MAITQDGTALAPNAPLPPALGSFSGNLLNAPTAPAVVTSKTAQDDLNKIKTDHADIVTGMATQKATVNAQKVQADALAAQKAKDDATAKAVQTTADAAKTAALAKATPQNNAAANPANAGQSGYDAQGNMIGGSSVSTHADGPTYTGIDGNQYYQNDGTRVPDNAPSSSTGTPQSDIETLSKQRLADAQAVHDQILGIQNGTIPLTAGEQAQVDWLKQQFQQLIDLQNLNNTGATGQAQMRGYQKGAAEYDPTFQVKTIGSIITAGAAKIATLNTQMASAVASLTQSFKTNDINAIKDAYTTLDDARKERQATIQKTIDDAQKQVDKAKADKIAADKVYFDEVLKPIQDINLKAVEAGAPADIQGKIKAAQATGDINAAIEAAGPYLQTATGAMGEYVFYKQNALASGVTPDSYEKWQAHKDAQALSLKTQEAYATARASAQGKASVEGLPGDTTPLPIGLGGTNTGGSILNATGLSVAAFNYLTQGTASMSRMTAAQRNQIMKEAENYLNRTGTDISTFQSQYQGYNKVLTANIERANNTKIFAGEITGTVDQFLTDIGNDFGNLKVGNVAKLLAGGQVNDPTVQKYAFDLQTMQNDLAGYYAASRTGGSNATPDDSDKRAAAQVIVNGLNGKSAKAFKDSITANEEKVTGVVNKNVDSTRKQVWELFGVGDKYKPGVNSSADSMVQTQKLDDTKAKSVIADYMAKSSTNDSHAKALMKLAPRISPSELMQQLGLQ